jgi:hypothetical protein
MMPVPHFSLFRPIMQEVTSPRHNDRSTASPAPRVSGMASKTIFWSFGFSEWLPKGFPGTSDLQSVSRSDFSWPQMFRREAETMPQPFGISDILQSRFIAATLVNQHHVAN